MRVRVHLPEEHATRLSERITKLAEKVEEVQTVDGRWEAVLAIDPSQFRTVNELLQKEAKGVGRVETLMLTTPASGS